MSMTYHETDDVDRQSGLRFQRPSLWFDYDNQAWVEDGVYRRCGHPESMDCRCYGRIHEGEPAA